MELNFYSREEYFQRIIAETKRAKPGDEVLLLSHFLKPLNPGIQEIFRSLGDAKKRGVTVGVGVDARSFHWEGRKAGGRAELPSSSEELGSSLVVLNQGWWRVGVPIAGSCHIKMTVLGDEVLLGSCNLENNPSIEMMVGISHYEGAQYFGRMVKRILAKGNAASAIPDGRRVILDESCEIILDAGRVGRSAIFHEALTAIDSAEEFVIFCCQFFPTGRVASALDRAMKRGLDVRVVCNSSRQFPGLWRPLVGAAGTASRIHLRGGVLDETRHSRDVFVHTKFLATEKEMLVGSHNLVEYGGWLGTAEATLKCREPQQVLRGVQFFLDSVQDIERDSTD